LINDVMRMINELSISAGELKLSPTYLAEIIKLVDAGTINSSTGKSLLEKVQETGISPVEIVKGEGLAQVSDQEAVRAICTEVLDENPDEVASYKNGKSTLMGWFVGQVMKKSRGKADPQLARSLLEDLLH
jgi:aspartyl-tRNA(Asn)/glutamyl-tRNA(Gln) amidotransferase subunit B